MYEKIKAYVLGMQVCPDEPRLIIICLRLFHQLGVFLEYSNNRLPTSQKHLESYLFAYLYYIFFMRSW